MDQRAQERAAIELIRPALLDSLAWLLTREPHVAGSDAQARTRDIVLDATRSWGLRSEAPEYRVYLPWADTVSLELVAGTTRQIVLGEPRMADAAERPQYPWVAGYSGTGTVEGEVVYANYGLQDDYAALDEAGVAVQGRVVIARFGRSFRGIKARLAEQHGAAALLLYSDPWDDGYFRGEQYFDGAWRAPFAAQRGSILNGAGDPTTPDGPRPTTESSSDRPSPSPRASSSSRT